MSLLQAIALEEALLGNLVEKRKNAQTRLEALKAELEALDAEPEIYVPRSPLQGTSPPTTAMEKVILFRRLFRGRDDVFPKLWVNAKTGRKGYSPACSNEWVRRVCEKPRVKCGECPNQAFLPVTDQVILDHLQGRHVMGAYPLLDDDTCCFLAADFDRECWMEDVSAFVETCRDTGIATAVERSRSGNGAHVWLFFTSPTPAAIARRMGSYLITETMARRHQLSMTSYDRLFPNQDTMPRGGFGNLIALPLQHGPRQEGNTVFVDENFHPHPDQWAYLASVTRMEPTSVERIASEAGIRIPEVRLIDLADGRHVLLVRRFDREWAGNGGWHPFHYMSGLTLLGLHEAENTRGAYPELADGLRRLSSDFPTDAEELFRRMVFNILVSNDDDHLRNHALLRLPGGWRLSPAYDLVPHPQVGYERRQSINVGRYGRDGTLENALSKAARFGLSPERAARIIKNVETTVRPWRRRFAEWGVREFDLERLQTAFLPESALQRY